MSIQENELFMHLLSNHLDYLYNKAIHLLRNAEKCEMLVQQTMQIAYDQFPQFNRDSSFTEWLDEIITSAYRHLSPQ